MFLLLFINGESSFTKHIAKISNNGTSWVKHCQDNRVYLKADSVVIEKESLYVLNKENQKILLTELFADSQGLYTRMESLGTEIATVYPIVWCSNCKAWRTANIQGKCSTCNQIP